MNLLYVEQGFDVEGKENFQEVLSKRLYLCQFLFALSILRPGMPILSTLHEVLLIKISFNFHDTNLFHSNNFVFVGGHFVCKLFDVFTVYSVGLMYLMWHAFDQVSIFKPVTSRPANSERFVWNTRPMFCRPPTKLREGNVFSRLSVWLSFHRECPHVTTACDAIGQTQVTLTPLPRHVQSSSLGDPTPVLPLST